MVHNTAGFRDEFGRDIEESPSPSQIDAVRRHSPVGLAMAGNIPFLPPVGACGRLSACYKTKACRSQTPPSGHILELASEQEGPDSSLSIEALTHHCS